MCSYDQSQGAKDERPRAMSGFASIATNESQGAKDERPREASGFAGASTKGLVQAAISNAILFLGRDVHIVRRQ